MKYPCEVASVDALVSLVVQYITHGYRFYVTGRVPLHKDASMVDQKLIKKFEVDVKRWTRSRRKKLGLANVRYLRHERFWIMLATPGRHKFFQEHPDQFRDVTRIPIRIQGYSISYRRGGFQKKRPGQDAQADSKWRASVRIDPDTYRKLRDYFLQWSTKSSSAQIGRELYSLPFEPYAPIRQQLIKIVRQVNRERRKAGLDEIPYSAIRYRRRIMRPYDVSDQAGGRLAPPSGRCEGVRILRPFDGD